MLPKIETLDKGHHLYLDLEHAYALMNFVHDLDSKKRILAVLCHPNCKAIVPISMAGAKSFQTLFSDKEIELFHSKIKVIYPALPLYEKIYKNQEDYSHIPSKNPHKKRFDLIFIGKDGYRKGLEEALLAFTHLYSKHFYLHLTVVSDTPSSFLSLYKGHPGISFFPPKFTSSEVIKRNFFSLLISLLCQPIVILLVWSISKHSPVGNPSS